MRVTELRLRSVMGQTDKTYRCYGSGQALTSPSDSVLCLLRKVHARFPSDRAHCSMVTSKSVCHRTALDGGLGHLFCLL